jgi:hypothetical protein
MYQTIQLSSCVSVQGEVVETLADGRAVIRVGEREFRGRPILKAAIRAARPQAVEEGERRLGGC